VGEETKRVAAGDLMFIPRNTVHGSRPTPFRPRAELRRSTRCWASY
jgi:hypothetical protein